MLKTSRRPDGKENDDALALILACTSANDASITTECACRRDFKSSHRPDGIFTCFALVLAGWRCVHRRWHGDLLIVHHHGQHSWLCACSRSKVPIAPMGKWLTCLPRLSLAQLQPTLWSTTVGTCRRDLEKFPWPRWDSHMFCACACRGAVCTSRVAQ